MIARPLLDSIPAVFVAEVHEDVISHSDRTRVVRRRLKGSDGLVVCKELLGVDAGVRLRHERNMLERLASVPGVARLAVTPVDTRMLVLEDVSGISLSQALRDQLLSMHQKVELALEIARIVAEIHRHGVVHRDINPANVLVSGPTWRPTLIDFNLASGFGEERPGFTHESATTGTLAYLAPEQTGRTSRAVDQRADLYSLGATFYELATGRAPFEGTDPLQLIRDHLARLPTPPSQIDPSVPAPLSDIVMRLLEKDPNRRYQSADGLAHDLARLRDQLSIGQPARFPLGERDFALRLAAPSRLIGREAETSALRHALDESLHSPNRSVLVAGAPGVGKSVLVAQLRAMVTAKGGWFVYGKCEQYRQETASPAINQALRSLGRLLFAEPKAELDRQREHILAVLGHQAGIVTAVLPEFLQLLGPQPEVGEAESDAGLLQAAVDLLRAVVSPTRPLVIVIDDLQWAPPVSLRLIERLISDSGSSGLLVVGTYRAAEIDAAHPLATMLPRWRELPSEPRLISLQCLPPTDVADLVTEMLRLPPSHAQRLADALAAVTHGNPFDTVEMINALRRDGILRCSDNGWHWDADALHRYVGQGSVVDLIAERIGKLPRETCLLMEAMACLGISVDITLLQAATGICDETLDRRLREPLEEGLLVIIRGESPGSEGCVRFRHDRVQQAAYGRLDATQREARHLALARRLSANPDFRFQAAEQYLPVMHAVQDAQERSHVTNLFRAAGARARQTLSHGAAARWLTQAMTMLSADADSNVQPAMAVIEIELHAALYASGELAEADCIYAAIEARSGEPLTVVDSACVQISSLCNRNCLDNAIALGLEALRRLGLRVDETHAGLAALHSRRLPMRNDDVLRPEVADPYVIACGKIINRLLPAVQVGADSMTWMVLVARAMWVEHGPCAALVGPVSHLAFVTMFDSDYSAGYDDVRCVLAVSESRGYEPQTSQARFLFAFSACHWFEPLEETLIHAQRAREGLLQGGDLQNACFSYLPTIAALFDCAPLLDDVMDEIGLAVAVAARTGNAHAGEPFVFQQQLVRELQGQMRQSSQLADASFGNSEHGGERAPNPFSMVNLHITCALAATLFGNDTGLLHHAQEAYRRLRYTEGVYPSALARLLYALALARRVRAAAEPLRSTLLAELDNLQDWWQQRAADAPANFGHLAWLVKAERACAQDDFSAAVRAYDIAMREVETRQRPWHRAFITERAGICHLDQGLVHTGQKLLAEARGLYEAWGANGKVQLMDHSYGFLNSRGVTHAQPSTHDGTRGSVFSSDAIDLMGVLRASQALSSETSLARLTMRVSELLGAMTGATAVSVAIWNDELNEWHLLAPELAGNAAQSIPVAEAGASGLLPLTAFHYADRTRQPLLVDDATRDDRFARDPYFAGQPQCSLLLVPIDSQGVPRAILLLENRLSGSAFSVDRLDAVTLIAGQLTVSLDNALVYASLERKVAERTDELEEANRRLALLCVTDPLTGIANRRHFSEILQAEWMRAQRPGVSIGLAMIDIDQFKLYNDHYGHPAGDSCLQRVAGMLKSSLRMTADVVARYGGEEFVVLLPNTDLAGAHAACRRLCSDIAGMAVPHDHSVHGIVTISVGVTAVVPAENDSPQCHISLADAALYEAKRGGRNRVVVVAN